ncbi:TIGR02117 family protein [Roseovarius sp. CAU 1744]|uniref:TIGR02117 family protein n=1 Tax=Roseovarius sp. CAU 1744 TaxID=3140368 RepID=UPI00325B8D70
MLIYMLAAVAGALIPGKHANVPDRGAPLRVLLIAGPIHYDFLLPLTDRARAQFSQLQTHGIPVNDPAMHWLVVGWGAREFYTSTGRYRDVRLPVLWRSFTGDTSVLRIDVAGRLPPGLPVQELTLSETRYTQLLTAIKGSFETDSAGDLLPIGRQGLAETDRFFQARGRFDALRTCNTWVSDMLRAAGEDFGIWTPTPYAVSLSLSWFHAN